MKTLDGMECCSAIAKKLGISYNQCREICLKHIEKDRIATDGKYHYYHIEDVKRELDKITNFPTAIPEGFDVLSNMHKHLGICSDHWVKIRRKIETPEPDGWYRSKLSNQHFRYYRITKIQALFELFDYEGFDFSEDEEEDGDERWPVPAATTINPSSIEFFKIMATLAVKWRGEK